MKYLFVYVHCKGISEIPQVIGIFYSHSYIHCFDIHDISENKQVD